MSTKSNRSYGVELASAASEAAAGLTACQHCKAVHAIVGALATKEAFTLRALEEISEMDCPGGKLARKHLSIAFPPEWKPEPPGHHD